jgi:Alpha/beta hydrolase family
MNALSKLGKVGISAFTSLDPERSARLAKRFFCTPNKHKYLPKAHELERLRSGRTRQIAGLTATIWGENQEATTLLVHGWQRHRASLSAFIDPLLEHNHRVVAFDAPAHGDSIGRETNPSMYADAINTIGGEFGPLKAIIGHSLGGHAVIYRLAPWSPSSTRCTAGSDHQYGPTVTRICRINRHDLGSHQTIY